MPKYQNTKPSKEIKNKLSKKLVMTLLVRNEEDIVDQCIKFHLNSGVDFIVATNNASTDSTREILEKYQKQGVLHLIDEPSTNYNQVAWVDRMIKIAKKQYKADFVINVDADEFWFCNYGNIKLALPDPKKFNVIYANSFQVNPPQDEDEAFEVKQNLLGHIMPAWKCIHAARNYKKIGMGNHEVKMCAGFAKQYFTLDITIFHFWIRSYAQYERKVINTYKSLEQGVKQGLYKEGVGEHIYKNYQVYLEGKLRENYQALAVEKSDKLIDNRLYNFINNGYKSIEGKTCQDFQMFNSPIKIVKKNKMEKLKLSLSRRAKEIKKYLP